MLCLPFLQPHQKIDREGLHSSEELPLIHLRVLGGSVVSADLMVKQTDQRVRIDATYLFAHPLTLPSHILPEQFAAAVNLAA